MTGSVKKRYRVATLGLGPRGHDHVQAFLNNADRFEVTALCDLDGKKLAEASAQYGVKALYMDVRKMLREEKPDVFCFITPVSIRREMVELAAQAGIKALALEKPIALTIREAYNVRRILDENGIKAVVSHQLKYLTSMQKLKQIIESGILGEITHVHATTVLWFMQLGTHFMDYLMWANGKYLMSLEG
jgi:predicted dehydrogenase